MTCSCTSFGLFLDLGHTWWRANSRHSLIALLLWPNTNKPWPFFPLLGAWKTTIFFWLFRQSEKELILISSFVLLIRLFFKFYVRIKLMLHRTERVEVINQKRPIHWSFSVVYRCSFLDNSTSKQLNFLIAYQNYWTFRSLSSSLSFRWDFNLIE